jgi:predicted Zn-dependent protease
VPTPVVDESGDQLREQILHDIESLQESKRVYEMTIARMEKETAQPLADKIEMPVTSEPKVVNSLIEEIKSTKKKIKPEGEKQKEQIEIIDQFIKTQPSIQRPKLTVAVVPDNDLAEPSAQFGENIVSETLVEILLKQGKKEKAIEALKKLIWKFPQKKAYFAAQIEELRK